MRRVLLTVTIAAAALGGLSRRPHVAAEERSSSSSAPAASALEAPQRIATEHLPNAIRVHPNVISGGEPAGEAGFAELKRLGVKTVISVDGAKPDTEAARMYGLSYIHLPHGYNGVPERRAKELTKAVRDQEGPIYIHCHHGKHRSPAATSVACVGAGLIPPAQALSVLQIAGTSRNYRGLYQSAKDAKPLDATLLDRLDVEFRALAEVPPMAEAMVALGHTHDHLEQIAAAGWRSPDDHPDLDPAHEALLLREHFAELRRTDDAEEAPARFRRLLRESEQAAQALEHGLREWDRQPTTAPAPSSLQQAADQIASNCKTCHREYRDLPLGDQ